jgi:hypothetical protein
MIGLKQASWPKKWFSIAPNAVFACSGPIWLDNEKFRICSRFAVRSGELSLYGEASNTPLTERRLQLRGENRQEGDFNCEAFVDVSTEMISQFFE